MLSIEPWRHTSQCRGWGIIALDDSLSVISFTGRGNAGMDNLPALLENPFIDLAKYKISRISSRLTICTRLPSPPMNQSGLLNIAKMLRPPQRK